MPVSAVELSRQLRGGAVVTVLRSLFSGGLENGMPPGQPSVGFSCQPAISKAMIPSALPSSAGDVGQLVQPHELEPDPVVVVVVLGPARPGRGRDGPVEGRQRARVGPFRGARVVGVEVVVRPVRRACSSCERLRRGGDVGHADGRRERLGEGPQGREGFAGVEPGALDVVSLLHRLEAPAPAPGCRGAPASSARAGGLRAEDLGRRAPWRPGALGPRGIAECGECRSARAIGGALGAGRIWGQGRRAWTSAAARGARTAGKRRGREAQRQAATAPRGRRIGCGPSSLGRRSSGGPSIWCTHPQALSGRRGVRLHGRRPRDRGRAPGRPAARAAARSTAPSRLPGWG